MLLKSARVQTPSLLSAQASRTGAPFHRTRTYRPSSAAAGSPPLAQWQRGVSLLDQSSNARLEQNGGQPT